MTAPEPMTCDLAALTEGELVDLMDWIIDRMDDMRLDDPEYGPLGARYGAAVAEIRRRPCRTYRGIRRKVELLVLEWPPMPDDPDYGPFHAAMADLRAVCEGRAPAG